MGLTVGYSKKTKRKLQGAHAGFLNRVGKMGFRKTTNIVRVEDALNKILFLIVTLGSHIYSGLCFVRGSARKEPV